MDRRYIKSIADKLSIKEWQVEHTIELLEEGATVPFISRYRKERTGRLDEVQVIEIKYDDYLPSYLMDLLGGIELRQDSVSKFILCHDKLTSLNMRT